MPRWSQSRTQHLIQEDATDKLGQRVGEKHSVWSSMQQITNCKSGSFHSLLLHPGSRRSLATFTHVSTKESSHIEIWAQSHFQKYLRNETLKVNSIVATSICTDEPMAWKLEWFNEMVSERKNQGPAAWDSDLLNTNHHTSCRSL